MSLTSAAIDMQGSPASDFSAQSFQAPGAHPAHFLHNPHQPLSSASPDCMESEPTPDLIMDASFVNTGLHNLSTSEADLSEHPSSGDYFLSHADPNSDGDSPWPNTPYQYSTFAAAKPAYDTGVLPHGAGFYDPAPPLTHTSSNALTAIDLANVPQHPSHAQPASSLDGLTMPYALPFHSPMTPMVPKLEPTSAVEGQDHHDQVPPNFRGQQFVPSRPSRIQPYAYPRQPSEASATSASESPRQSPLTAGPLRSPTTASASATTGTGTSRRPKVPHTQAERRYRENLNAHLDELRRLLARVRAQRNLHRQRQQQQQSSTASEGRASTNTISPNPPDSASVATAEECFAAEIASWKPSKAEVIASAIEYIQSLEMHNRILLGELQSYRGV